MLCEMSYYVLEIVHETSQEIICPTSESSMIWYMLIKHHDSGIVGPQDWDRL